jgi:hypothetical protein
MTESKWLTRTVGAGLIAAAATCGTAALAAPADAAESHTALPCSVVVNTHGDWSHGWTSCQKDTKGKVQSVKLLFHVGFSTPGPATPRTSPSNIEEGVYLLQAVF